MNIIYINHNQKAHFEILFSIIDYLTNPKSTIEFIPPIKHIYPFLYNSKIILKPEFIETDKYKKKFFSNNYTDINLEINSEIFIEQIYDFNIITTVYPEMIDELKIYKNDSRFLLISHEINDCFDEWNNVYYHMPLGKRYFIPNYFPFYKNLPKSCPKIYIVQGSINLKRRNYYSLIPIFEKYEKDNFVIRILGKGRELPNFLVKYKNKIQFLNDKNFVEYHNYFNDVSFILPLIDNSFNHLYFTKKYTSSIAYGMGYNIPFIAHTKLKEIYPIQGYFYSSQKDFIDKFGLTLSLK